jgi:putative ABC transport system permease protein
MLLQNYIATGWRNTIKHKLFSGINIFGLAIGLSACYLIMLFVNHETSYDKFWNEADKIHRAHIKFTIPGRDPMPAVTTPGPAIHALKKDFPQVEAATRISNSSPVITINGETFIESITLVDADFTKVFNLNVLHGDPALAMQDKNSLVLGKELAVKLFGTDNPVGQVLDVDFDAFERQYKIVAVIDDIADNSQLEIPAFALIDENDWAEQEWRFAAWFSVNSQLYFKTAQASDLNDIQASLPDFVTNNFPKLPFGGKDKTTSDFIEMQVMNIQDLHLKADGFGEMKPRGSQSSVVIFSAIAVLILIIAIINFTNLSTAKASQRAKEVALRKVMGASKSNLVAQFLGESILLTLLALCLAIGLIELTLPLYNDVLNLNLAVDYSPLEIGKFVGATIAVGILGGLYPAFILSSFKPASVLKANKSAETSASMKLRAALVVIQFTVSIGLFISTGVVYSQMLYTEMMDPGFNKENVMVVHRISRDEAAQQRESLISEFKKLPQAEYVTWSSETPGRTSENNTSLRTEAMSMEDAQIIGNRRVGYNFFETFQIDVVAGRTYDENRSDVGATTEQLRNGEDITGSMVVNESALKRLGLGSPQEALGKLVFMGRGNPGEELEAKYKIIGVVADVHFDSLRSTIRPEIYPLNTTWSNSISIRFNGDPQTMLQQVEDIWNKQVPSLPLWHTFVEDDLAEQYQAEQGQAKMFAAFSMLAIFVACLGLFGLASYSAERRKKEISIRKVMGAEVFDIVKLMLWQFSKPVLWANLIAWPVAYWLMSDWLEAFVYRIDSSYIFALSFVAGLAALLIAWVTVGSNAIQVARTNPIKALRYE